MKREIGLMLLLGVLGLVNMGFNFFKSWNVKENNYSVEITCIEVYGTFPGLKTTLNFDQAQPEHCLIRIYSCTQLEYRFFSKNQACPFKKSSAFRK